MLFVHSLLTQNAEKIVSFLWLFCDISSFRDFKMVSDKHYKDTRLRVYTKQLAKEFLFMRQGIKICFPSQGQMVNVFWVV